MVDSISQNLTLQVLNLNILFQIQGLDGNPKTVGFFVGSSKTRLLCIEPLHIPIIKEAHVKVASAFQDYIRSSELAAHLDLYDGGYWRSLIVRSDNNTNNVMATVVMKPQNLTESEIENEKSKLAKFFQDGPGREANLTTLYFQRFPIDIGGGKKSESELVFGPPRISVELFGHQFHVGPLTFFPGNLHTAEKFMKLLRSQCSFVSGKNESSNFQSKKSKKLTLFDVGCGAGIHSILFSNKFHQCIGFDVSREAVDDAIYNAEIFGASNKCNFVAGPYVKTLPNFLRNLENEAGIGIVILNPGRLGIDRLVISQIRDCSLVKKVIYISSNPEGESFACFRDLCREVTKETKKNRYSLVPISKHFSLNFAVPIDAYPHSAHCQHAFVFTRH